MGVSTLETPNRSRAFRQGQHGERFVLMWLNDEDGREVWEWYTTPARFAAANYSEPEQTCIDGENWTIGTVVE